MINTLPYKVNSNRRLTQNMIEMLMDCHEKEIMNLEPYNAGAVPYARGLILRGMLTTNRYTTQKGKRYIALYLTSSAKDYLSKL